MMNFLFISSYRDASQLTAALQPHDGLQIKILVGLDVDCVMARSWIAGRVPPAA
jgi:hypothetical protein